MRAPLDPVDVDVEIDIDRVSPLPLPQLSCSAALATEPKRRLPWPQTYLPGSCSTLACRLARSLLIAAGLTSDDDLQNHARWREGEGDDLDDHARPLKFRPRARAYSHLHCRSEESPSYKPLREVRHTHGSTHRCLVLTPRCPRFPCHWTP